MYKLALQLDDFVWMRGADGAFVIVAGAALKNNIVGNSPSMFCSLSNEPLSSDAIHVSETNFLNVPLSPFGMNDNNVNLLNDSLFSVAIHVAVLVFLVIHYFPVQLVFAMRSICKFHCLLALFISTMRIFLNIPLSSCAIRGSNVNFWNDPLFFGTVNVNSVNLLNDPLSADVINDSKVNHWIVSFSCSREPAIGTTKFFLCTLLELYKA